MADTFVNPLTDEVNLAGKVVQVREWNGCKLYRAANGRGCAAGAPNNPIQLGPLYSVYKLKNRWIARGKIVGWVEEEDVEKLLLWMALNGENNEYD